jgi:hypothetical protein
MQAKLDSRGTSGKAPLRARRPRRAVARNAMLVPPSRMEGPVTFFALQRLSRYASQVGFTRHHGRGAASRAGVRVRTVARNEARLLSRMEGAVTFFARERLSRYAGQAGVARSAGQVVVSRTASHRAVARKVQLISPSSMEGAVTFFSLKRLSRYAGQVGFTRRLGQGASRAASASSSRAQRGAHVADRGWREL